MWGAGLKMWPPASQPTLVSCPSRNCKRDGIIFLWWRCQRRWELLGYFRPSEFINARAFPIRLWPGYIPWYGCGCYRGMTCFGIYENISSVRNGFQVCWMCRKCDCKSHEFLRLDLGLHFKFFYDVQHKFLAVFLACLNACMRIRIELLQTFGIISLFCMYVERSWTTWALCRQPFFCKGCVQLCVYPFMKLPNE